MKSVKSAGRRPRVPSWALQMTMDAISVVALFLILGLILDIPSARSQPTDPGISSKLPAIDLPGPARHGAQINQFGTQCLTAPGRALAETKALASLSAGK